MVEERKCPTCGQPMDFIKSEKKSIVFSKPKKSIKYEDINGKGYDIMEIWHCLNCSEEWKIDIFKNIWRKNTIMTE